MLRLAQGFFPSKHIPMCQYKYGVYYLTFRLL